MKTQDFEGTQRNANLAPAGLKVKAVCSGQVQGGCLCDSATQTEQRQRSWLLWNRAVQLRCAFGSTPTLAFMLLFLNCSVSFAQQPGTKLWQFPVKGESIYSPAVASDGTIYVGSFSPPPSSEAILFAITPTGVEKWSVDLGFATENGITAAVGGDGMIYAGGYGFVCAVTPEGLKRWSSNWACPNWTYPTIGSDGTIYASRGICGCFAFLPDGANKWSRGIWGIPSIGWDGRLYGNGVSLNRDGSTNQLFSSLGSAPTLGLNGSIYSVIGTNLFSLSLGGTTNWVFHSSRDITSSPSLAADQTIYVGIDSNLVALDASGAQKWAFETRGVVRSSPAVSADGTIYFGSEDNNLYAVAADGTKRWEFATAGAMRSPPAIGADGTVYSVSADGNLYAIKETAGLAISPWPKFRGNARNTGNAADNLDAPSSGTSASVANVRGSQRPGTTLVDLFYDLSGPGSSYSVSVAVSSDGGATFVVPATHFSGDGVTSPTAPGANRHIVWDAGADFPGQFSTRVRFRVTVTESLVPPGMALIPAGSFTMGNCMDANEGLSDELPLHTVYVSAFCMDKYEVTKALWDEVYQWATNHSYIFDNTGSGKAANHPVQSISWYDAVKWCNARSEQEGRVPAYYTSAAQTAVYRTGRIDVQNDWVKWNVGYRLPTEAEWEKAARGGASGHRFPWSDVDTITHSKANYYSSLSRGYDISPTRGYHPAFNDRVYPYTSPVGYFAANGYGLYDMAGNVWEWCWDWYGDSYYSNSPGTDPRGPASGSYRVFRGGGWYHDDNIFTGDCRTALRSAGAYPTDGGIYGLGFRSVLPSNPPPGGNAAEAVSAIFTLDTRAVPTGTLTGVVQAGGAPVAKAQARIDGTGFATTTGADGRFTLANIPSGSGYVLKVSAAGYGSKQVSGLTVTSGARDVGTISLSTLSGPYRLVPLQPDVNPPVTQIENGGVGYRYYRVLSADGRTPAGGVNVALRVAGGSTISQSGDISDSWAGRVAGVSDDDGIVRLRVPAAELSGGTQTFEVIESGTVKQQFQASVVRRWHDKVWKHRVEAEASTGKAILKLGGSGALETEVRDRYADTLVLDETIQRTRELDARLGAEFDFTGPALGGVQVGANGVGGFKVIDMYGFPPDTTMDLLNLEKVYMALGDEMSVVLGPAPQIYDQLRKLYAPDLYAAILRSTAGEIHAGGEFNASAELGVGAEGSQSLRFGTDLEGSIIGYFQAENQYQVGQLVERTRELGLRAGLSASLNGGGNNVSSKTLKELGFSGNVSQNATIAGKVWFDPATSEPLSVGAEFESEVNAGMDLSALGWQGVGGSLGPGWTMSAKESLHYDLPSAAAYGHIQALSPVWNYLVGSFNAAWRLTGQAGSGLLPAILVASEQDGVPLNYERSVYRGVRTDAASKADLDKVLDGLGLTLDLSMERGAEAVVEQGVIWQRERLPLKWRPDDTASLVPSENILSKEAQWVGYAAPMLKSAWNIVKHAVSLVGDTFIQVGAGARQAVLQIGQGVMGAGSSVVSKFVGGPSGSGLLMANYGPWGHQPKNSSLPNLSYGIGGIYRFESTNSFNGTATLTIAYNPTEVAGFNPADLRMYYLPDGTNRWQLVGGTVNVASNTVTAVISRLGTYAVAPPLPTGDLQLTPSTTTLAADGMSQMTVMVTNMLLNNGATASEHWLFTATAAGVTLLNPDLDPATPGVQVLSTNGAVSLFLRAPVGGTVGHVSLASVVGDAFGSTAINLLDNSAPASPAGMSVTAGQSRISVSWQANSEPDLAGYRVYYKSGASGPPWDGTAAVEGRPSPVMVTDTNCLLHGLAVGTNYFVAVSSVDTTGNESPLSAAIQVTTTAGAPMPPTSVTVRFGVDGTNILMWALSEDDGYNDRDVVHYEIWRAVLPGGSYVKAGEVAAGGGVFSDTKVVIQAGQYVSYAITSVASGGASSPPTSAMSLVSPPFFNAAAVLPDGSVQLRVTGIAGLSYTVQASTNLLDWTPVTTLVNTDGTMTVVDMAATNLNYRFYRAVSP